MTYFSRYPSHVGDLVLVSDGTALTALTFGSPDPQWTYLENLSIFDCVRHWLGASACHSLRADPQLRSNREAAGRKDVRPGCGAGSGEKSHCHHYPLPQSCGLRRTADRVCLGN